MAPARRLVAATAAAGAVVALTGCPESRPRQLSSTEGAALGQRAQSVMTLRGLDDDDETVVVAFTLDTEIVSVDDDGEFELTITPSQIDVVEGDASEATDVDDLVGVELRQTIAANGTPGPVMPSDDEGSDLSPMARAFAGSLGLPMVPFPDGALTVDEEWEHEDDIGDEPAVGTVSVRYQLTELDGDEYTVGVTSAVRYEHDDLTTEQSSEGTIRGVIGQPLLTGGEFDTVVVVRVGEETERQETSSVLAAEPVD